MVHILITGGAGFIGSHCVEECIERGIPCTVIDIDCSPSRRISHPHVAYVEGDITNPETFKKIEESPTHIIHLAAAISVTESMRLPTKYRQTNVEGSKRVYEFGAACKCHRIVSASTAAVYGNPKEIPVKEDTLLSPLSPYAETKLEMEKIGRSLACKKQEDVPGMFSYADESGSSSWTESSSAISDSDTPAPREDKCPHAAEQKDRPKVSSIQPFPPLHFLRFFNVYGPRQDPSSPYTGVISTFAASGQTGKNLIIYGDGTQTRDFVFVKDVVSGIFHLLLSPVFDETSSLVFNVGTGRGISILELAHTVLRLVKSPKSKIIHSEARPGDIKHSCANISSFKDNGWKPKISFEDGLKMTLSWIEHEYKCK
ncbi:UDP-glucose 4-epimerase [Aduncisulcus paluster]|uniref:UDP-glucose 4-epimerase n=1 Tax=Aduncisulcus paluster TaxID=2918883 RepID=A0ABQ5KSW4_9EUKA|nr:UDP-glucose 4-epimerase [Aduncisulcus paluster]